MSFAREYPEDEFDVVEGDFAYNNGEEISNSESLTCNTLTY